ncbi:hypothetical protein GCM10010387_05140 [Streptomyces inusitatus]|uniref:Uncharacterized protein n=1 Tax=Streptomyces inusitatus TaxID=68221 RepID=A0A918PNE9_9ACTN|nr:hypothetical protein [Streptomyces inusitatus]GGZ15688.1 hypothetical protein GCM10010387_05140 [Streptomyces inusitatus]
MRGPAEHGEHTRHAEDELRVLLERATPKLAAPEGRLRQVRERVARRRRRRAGAAVLVASALAVAGTVLPTALRDAGLQPVRPAASESEPAPGPSYTQAEPPVPWGEEKVRSVRFPLLAGATVDLPESWRALTVPAVTAAGGPAEAVGYVGTVSLTGPADSCEPETDTGCASLEKLGREDVLIRLTDGTSTSTSGSPDRAKSRNGPDLPRRTDSFCERVGGDLSYTTEALDEGTNYDLRTDFDICVHVNASEETMSTVQRIVNSTRFREMTAPTAPTAPLSEAVGKTRDTSAPQ